MRLSLSIGFVLGLVVLVLALLSIRLLEDAPGAETTNFRRLAIEFGFVFAVLIGYVGHAARGLGRLVSESIEEQVATLEQARSGQSARRAVVVTSDDIGRVSHQINGLLDSLAAASQDAERANAAILRALIGLASTRDNETGAHLRRTQLYVDVLCDALTKRGIELSDRYQTSHIVAAAPLHDIGKVGVPDEILRKPGKLSDDEFAAMKEHVAHGLRVVEAVIRDAGPTPFLLAARDVITGHHERFDGRGYPAGISGDDISWAGRVMALADVYDALRSARVYKAAFSHEDARNRISAASGTQFDPRVVAAFLDKEAAFNDIAARFAEAPSVPSASAA